jgi:hypothetical protein
MTSPKAIKLLGSCHCKAIKYSLKSSTPTPFSICYCGVCRKLNGGSGSCIAITGDATTFQVEGTQHLGIYRPVVEEKGKSHTLEGWHHFCKLCGTQLYIWTPSKPNDINPMASSIDTELPIPPERHHIFLKDKAPWVHVPEEGKTDFHFDEFAPTSPPEWHKEKNLP